jgi:hypothetical protein
MRISSRQASFVACVLLAGCSGAGHALGSLPNTGLQASQRASASLRIVIPPKSALPTSSTARKPAYISPATQSIAVSFAPAGGGSPLTFNQNLTTAANPNCTASLVSTLLCTVSFSLPSGSYTATFATYDGLLQNGEPTGNVLSANQSLPVTIAIGQANAISVSLAGIPASLVALPQISGRITPTGTAAFTMGTCFQSEIVSVYALDADGDVIIGPGAPVPSLSTGGSSLVAVDVPSASNPNAFPLYRTAPITNGTPVTLTAGLTALAAAGGAGIPPQSLAFTFASQVGDDSCGVVSTWQSGGLTYPVGVAIPAFNSLIVFTDAQTNDVMGSNGGSSTYLIAGNGSATSVDGSNGSAGFNAPTGLAWLGHTVIYVAETGANKIRSITLGGSNVTATVAGTGTLGFTNGPGASATFSAPTAVAVNQMTGTVYVADTGNNAIRAVDAMGNVTTYAGTGVAGFRDGPAAVAQFNAPQGVALDAAGNLYVADTGNNRIRMISMTGNVTTIAGTSAPLASGAVTPGPLNGAGLSVAFNGPHGITVGPNNVLYVSETFGQRIRAINLPSGYVTLVAGSPTGTGTAVGYTDATGSAAAFNYPQAIAFDAYGDLLIADQYNRVVRRIVGVGGPPSP